MKIVHIVPGSGDTFYCENCLRDSELVNTLRKMNHDVIMVPMYLPLFLDNPKIIQNTPVFFGGINVYLQQKFKLFRKTPRWLDKLFDAHWLLAMAARKSGSTRANSLGPMTLSMLEGEHGNQAKELDRLVSWLKHSEKPDIIHVSNILLIGLAETIKKTLNVPLVFSLQDEDTWLDAMDEPFNRLCWEKISEKSRFVDKFVAVSQYYADIMQKRVNIPADKISVIHIGINPEYYKPSALPFNPPVIGYLARMADSLGLGILVDAFTKLKKLPEYKNLKLKICGGGTSDDRIFLDDLRSKLSANNILDDVTFVPSFERETRMEFLQSLTLLSVPVPQGEAFGTYIIESLAAGVPVVQPEAGAFPELIKATGGGVVYKPGSPDALAIAIESLLSDQTRLTEMSQRGRLSVVEKFNITDMALKTLRTYESLTGK